MCQVLLSIEDLVMNSLRFLPPVLCLVEERETMLLQAGHLYSSTQLGAQETFPGRWCLNWPFNRLVPISQAGGGGGEGIPNRGDVMKPQEEPEQVVTVIANGGPAEHKV